METNGNLSNNYIFCTKNSPGFPVTLTANVMYLLLGFINIIFAGASVYLNFMFLFIVYRVRKLQVKKHILLVALSVNDLLIGLIVQTLLAMIMITLGLKKSFCTIINVSSIIGYGLGSSSFVTLLLIACERYIAVALPCKYDSYVTVRNIFIVTTTCYISSVSAVMLCYFSGNFLILYSYIAGIITVTATIMIFCYVKINMAWKKVRNNPEQNAQNQKQKRKSAWSTTRMTLLLLVAVIVCYFPSLCYSIYIAQSKEAYRFGHRYLLPWVQTLSLINSTLDPLVYFFRMEGLRLSIKQLVSKKVGVINTGITNNASLQTWKSRSKLEDTTSRYS